MFYQGSIEECTKIEKEKTNDTRYAFIKWKNELDKFHVVSMNDVEKKDKFTLNEEVRVKWNNKNHFAILLFIGN